MSTLVTYCGGESVRQAQCFVDLACFFGVDARLLDVGSQPSADALAGQLDPAVAGVAMSASTLMQIRKHGQDCEGFISTVTGNCRQLFIYGFEPTEQHAELVRWLTNGLIRRVVHVARGDICAFPPEGKAFTQQLSGSVFARRAQPSDCGFDFDVANRSATVLMRIGEQANLVRVACSGGGLFLWAGNDMPQLTDRLPLGEGLPAFYDCVLPPLVFVRHAFPLSCWKNPEKTARVTIDDPLLCNPYGFLNYDNLLRSMERLDYALTIAFIPWNYRRTKPKEAQRFLANRHRLSLCVHGCDHTNYEYGIADGRLLEQKTSCAIERMKQHQARTGLPFENVMVFPQGRFSTAALLALRRGGLLAAVNSTYKPTNVETEGISITDVLLPAVNRYHGFPVFHRRSLKHTNHLAVDLFLGKPAYIVEHHDCFEHGCETLENGVRALKAIEPRLTWPSLTCALQRAHLQKQAAANTVDVRFFTGAFAYENRCSESVCVRFSKSEPRPDLIRAVRAGDRVVEFKANSQSIEFQMELMAGEKVNIVLEDRDEPCKVMFTPSLAYRINTGVRLHLSELRDQHLVKHPWALKMAHHAVRFFKVTSDTIPGRKT